MVKQISEISFRMIHFKRSYERTRFRLQSYKSGGNRYSNKIHNPIPSDENLYKQSLQWKRKENKHNADTS